MEFPFLYDFPSSQARLNYIEQGTDIEIYNDVFLIKQISTGQTIEISNPIYKAIRFNKSMTEKLHNEAFKIRGTTDVTKYKNKYYYTVFADKDTAAHMFPYTYEDKNPTIISFYLMDDELWLAPYWGDSTDDVSNNNHKIDFIARLKPKAD